MLGDSEIGDRMAKSKSRGQRGNNFQPLATGGLLSDIVDDRQFSFERPRAALSVSGNVMPVGPRGEFKVRGDIRKLMEFPERIKNVRPRMGNPALHPVRMLSHVAFEVPKRTVVCVRRKVRREVMFAKRRTGKGSSRSYRHRSQWSDVRC